MLIQKDTVFSIECENHSYFFRIVSLFNQLSNNILDESYINKDDLINKIIKLEDYLIISNTPISEFNTVKPKLDIKRIYDYYKNDIGINCHALRPVYLKEVEAVEKMGGYND